MTRCIIMCAGEYAAPLVPIREQDYVIAADNGLAYLDRMGIHPDHIIGDYDSLKPEEKPVLASVLSRTPQAVTTLPVEKDDTDSLAAVKYGFAQGMNRFCLLCALGGRLDHSIANIQTLVYIREHGGRGWIEGGDCLIFVLRDETFTFPAGMECTFSLFSLDKEIHGVTIQGMKYEVSDVTIANSFPIGVSNHISREDKASVTVSDGTALVILTGKLTPDQVEELLQDC